MLSIASKAGLIALFLLVATDIFAQIPVDTQAKLLDARIAEAYRSHNNEALIGYIEQYRALGAYFPKVLLVSEAHAAYELGDAKRALSALNAYLKVATKTDDLYEDAIQLYPEVEHKADTDAIVSFLLSIPGQMREVPGGRFQMGTNYCANLPSTFNDTNQYQ